MILIWTWKFVSLMTLGVLRFISRSYGRSGCGKCYKYCAIPGRSDQQVFHGVSVFTYWVLFLFLNARQPSSTNGTAKTRMSPERNQIDESVELLPGMVRRRASAVVSIL